MDVYQQSKCDDRLENNNIATRSAVELSVDADLRQAEEIHYEKPEEEGEEKDNQLENNNIETKSVVELSVVADLGQVEETHHEKPEEEGEGKDNQLVKNNIETKSVVELSVEADLRQVEERHHDKPEEECEEKDNQLVKNNVETKSVVELSVEADLGQVEETLHEKPEEEGEGKDTNSNTNTDHSAAAAKSRVGAIPIVGPRFNDRGSLNSIESDEAKETNSSAEADPPLVSAFLVEDVPYAYAIDVHHVAHVADDYTAVPIDSRTDSTIRKYVLIIGLTLTVIALIPSVAVAVIFSRNAAQPTKEIGAPTIATNTDKNSTPCGDAIIGNGKCLDPSMCCSQYGYCGSGIDETGYAYCGYSNVDPSMIPCGAGDRGNGTCLDPKAPCCSQYGYCGKGAEYGC